MPDNIQKIAIWKEVTAKLKSGVFSASYLLMFVGVVAMVLLVLIPLVDIVLRRVFISSLPGAYELSELVLGLVVFTSLSYCAVRGMHIIVDVAVSWLPKKTQNKIEIFSYFCSWAMMGIISWQLIKRGINVLVEHDVSAILYIPTYPFVFIAGLGCAMLAIVLFIQFLDKMPGMENKWN